MVSSRIYIYNMCHYYVTVFDEMVDSHGCPPLQAAKATYFYPTTQEGTTHYQPSLDVHRINLFQDDAIESVMTSRGTFNETVEIFLMLCSLCCPIGCF